jgi:hypothetical protein
VDSKPEVAAIQREWLLKTLDVNTVYSVTRTVKRPRADGVLEDITDTGIFEVIAVSHVKSRGAKVMPTVALPDELMMRAPVAYQVSWMDECEWGPEEAGTTAPPNSKLVHRESDSEWVVPARIAPFDRFVNALYRWPSVAPLDGNPAIIVLSGRERAEPRYALEDSRCPVITLAARLRTDGWTTTPKTVLHTALEDKIYDGRGGLGMRHYLRVLLFGMETALRLIPGGYRASSL